MINGVAYDDIWSLNGRIVNPELQDIESDQMHILYQIGTINTLIEWERECIDGVNRSVEHELATKRRRRSYISKTDEHTKKLEHFQKNIRELEQRRERPIADFEQRQPEGQITLF